MFSDHTEFKLKLEINNGDIRKSPNTLKLNNILPNNPLNILTKMKIQYIKVYEMQTKQDLYGNPP